jgi:hypothetical protein
MSTTLADTMNAAREAAQNLPANQDATGTAVATSAPDATVFSTGLDDFLSGGGIRPDKWLQVKDAGIRIDRDDKAFVTEFTADFDLSEFKLFWGSRAEFAGNNVQYAKSYDGKLTDKGENFNQVLAEFKAGSVKDASPYRGADIIATLDEDVTQGKTVVPAGTRIGYSTSITGFAPFQTFLANMKKQGKLRAEGDGDIVKVKITHQLKTNPKGQDYGILLFDLA